MDVLDNDINDQLSENLPRIEVKEIIKFYIPLGFIGMMNLTMKADNVHPDGGPDLYGFPMAFMSSTWVNSFEHEIYLTGLLVDLIFYSILALFLFQPLLNFIRQRSIKKLMTYAVWTFTLMQVLSFIIFFKYLRFYWLCSHPNNFMVYSLHTGSIPF
ncbi:MAG: hypothetical protein DWQ02_06125 [Bacteroidetes bacterium]|nr:MAG: hypothetical protein DWQ02_06125 [Bacteroidota bacterium]